MTKKLLAFAVVLPLCAANAVLPVRAQTNPAAASTTAAPLPVRAVTLFSSGVSYTLREGEVSGNAIVPLTFRTTQINDILKSLVLLDEKGKVQPAIYAAKDPIGRTLQSFAVDVSQTPSLADLLNQMRGSKVVVDAGGMVIAANTTTPKRTLEGQIVGVEGSDRNNNGGFGGAATAYLSVLGDAGLQTVRLSEVNSVRLLDERLNREFREALGLLASGSDDKRRQVTLRFDGDGKRRVRVGYVSEAPLWKISYRLLIGGSASDGPSAAVPYLQGWALVENTTDEDWNNVRLALVSGRPVSFIQDLYQPLYLPRPVVPPDVVASPYPQVAEGTIEGSDGPPPPPSPVAAAPSTPANKASRSGRNSPAGGGFGGGGLGGGGLYNDSVAGVASEAAPADMADARFKGDSGIRAQATGEKSGELFQYNITTPVTLPRQQAAMIPVIAQNIAGEKVSLYNADTNARFPLNAFRVVNNTTLHLKGGPVTIFDKNVYAGDARMEDVPPGDSRLVTYAVDLAVEGERQGVGYSTVETSFIIRRGILYTSRRSRMTTDYTLKNKASDTRTVLVEHPFNSSYKLIAPEKSESRTPSFYRFAVVVAPGKSEKLQVVTEQSNTESVGLINQDLNTLAVYVERGEVPEKIKVALREVLARRRRVQELQSQAASADAEIASIDKDQDRIRKNMAALDKTSALYKRYVTQLDTQENRIQSLRTEATRLRTLAAQAERDLKTYLDGLELTP